MVVVRKCVCIQYQKISKRPIVDENIAFVIMAGQNGTFLVHVFDSRSFPVLYSRFVGVNQSNTHYLVSNGRVANLVNSCPNSGNYLVFQGNRWEFAFSGDFMNL